MISKNRIKNIRALALKKNRDATFSFVAEGPKVVQDLLRAFPCTYIAALPEWFQENPIPREQNPETESIDAEELQKISFLQHPQDVLAVFKKPQDLTPSAQYASQELCLALDDIQNPGNLGTIIRLADWFGITHIFCSPSCADAFGNKVVQATMGALARVKIHYIDLAEFFQTLTKDIPVYGTFLNGEDIYRQHLHENGIIVMGNEGNGISPEIEQFITKRLYIPNFPPGRPTSESLNVAVATAITCAEFRRQNLSPRFSDQQKLDIQS